MNRRALYLVNRNLSRVFEADRDGGLIGRRIDAETDREIDISIDASGVSHRHARWTWVGPQEIRLEDISTNGTWINGEKIHKSTRTITPGHRLEFGRRGEHWTVSASPPDRGTEGNDLLVFRLDADVVTLVIERGGQRSRPLHNVWLLQIYALAEAAWKDQDAGALPGNRGWRTRTEIWKAMGRPISEYDANLIGTHWYNANARLKKELGFEVLQLRDREGDDGWVREYRIVPPSGGIHLPRGREVLAF